MKQQTNKEILFNALPDIKDGIKKIDYIFDKIFHKFYFGEEYTEEEMYTMRLCVKLLQTFGFIKGCIEKEKKEMGEITADKVRSAALKTIERGDSRSVRCVDSNGGVCYGGCGYGRGVRPFFIIKS